MATETNGLQIINISDPTKPIKVGSLPPLEGPGRTKSLQVVGDYVFMADRNDGLHVIDVQDATNPKRVAVFKTDSPGRGVKVAGNLAFVIADAGQLYVIDVSEPSTPVQLSKYTLDSRDVLAWRSVDVIDGYAYLTTTAGLITVDVRQPKNPVQVSRLGAVRDALDLKLVGGKAFVLGYPPGLQVVDIQDPFNPVSIGQAQLDQTGWKMDVVGNYAYVADVGSGLVVLDISQATHPVTVGRSSISAFGVQVVGKYAYVADGEYGLQILEVSQGYSNTVAFSPPSYVTMDKQFITLPQKSTSGGVVTYTVVSGPGRVEGERLVLTGAGTIQLRADQDGDGNFAAFNSEWSIGVEQVYQDLVWKGDTNTILKPHIPYDIGASASSGLPVTLRVEAGPASIRNGKIVVDGIGTIVVTATQEGNAAFYPARFSRSYNVRLGSLTQVGSYYTGGSAESVHVVGDFAYLADGDGGLQIIDISVPSDPARVGGYNSGGFVRSVQVVGSYAYVADSLGLDVLDISNPINTRRIGGYEAPGFPGRVHLAGDYAYLLGSDLKILNVKNPANVIPVGGRAYVPSGDFRVAGNYAYIADPGVNNVEMGRLFVGLSILDISQPQQPVWVAKYESLTTEVATDVEVVGNHAYLLSGDKLDVVNISDPLKPNREGGYYIGLVAQGIEVAGNYAYVALGKSGFEIIYLSDLTRPDGIAWHDTPGSVNRVQSVGKYVYVADGGAGLQIFELKLRYPQAISWTGTTNQILNLNSAYALGATANSDLPVTFRVKSGPAAITNGMITATGVGTVIVEAEQTGDDMFWSAHATRSFNVRAVAGTIVNTYKGRFVDSTRVDVAGNYAFLVDSGYQGGELYSLKLQVLGIANPARPTLAGKYQSDGWAGYVGRVQVLDNYAFLTAGMLGLEIISIADPEHPVRVGGYKTVGAAGGMEIVGNLAYVADETAGLQIIDVSNPTNPVRLGRYATRGKAAGVSVVGKFAYIGETEAGVEVVDVSNPSEPRRISEYLISGKFVDLKVVGDFAYVALGYNAAIPGGHPAFSFYGVGMEVIDISNPAVPKQASLYSGPGFSTSVEVVGSHAYLTKVGGLDGDIEGAVVVFDVSDPYHPIRVGALPPFYAPREGNWDIRVVENRAFVIRSDGDLQIFDLQWGFPQNLDLRLPTSIPFEGLPLLSIGTAGSGLPISYSVLSGPAAIVEDRLISTGIGPVTLRAEQVGNESYLPTSTEWTSTFTVAPPRIDVRLADAGVELIWDSRAVGFKVQSRDSFSTESKWQNLAAPALVTGNQFRVRLEADGSDRYFRLLKD